MHVKSLSIGLEPLVTYAFSGIVARLWATHCSMVGSYSRSVLLISSCWWITGSTLEVVKFLLLNTH